MQHPRFFTPAWWKSLSKWWVAMMVTSFITGLLLVYLTNKPDWKYICAISAFISFWCMHGAAASHYYRNRLQSQVNLLPALLLAGGCIILLTFSFLLAAPQLLQAVLTGFTASAVMLVGKNMLVDCYIKERP